VIDDLPRLADCLGKNLLLIEAPPLDAIVKLNEVSQRAARTEKLLTDWRQLEGLDDRCLQDIGVGTADLSGKDFSSIALIIFQGL